MALRKYLNKYCETNPVLRNTPEMYSMTKEERMERQIAVIKEGARLAKKMPRRANMDLISEFTIQQQMVLPIGMHFYLFTPAIKYLASDEQQKTWMPLCSDMKIHGCYAQTELGHGSNV